MNIDDIADDKTNTSSPGEKFYEDWLADLPRNQWPTYIDESAQLVADGIGIGDTNLMKADFGPETGEYYVDGLAKSAGIDADSTSLPLGDHSAVEIGRVAWTFNRLREEIRNSEHTDFENPSRAIEAAINKALVEYVETGQIEVDEIENIRLPESTTISSLVSEVFCRPRSQTYVELLLRTVKDTAAKGLLERLDQPRMVTPLWEHQTEALEAWFANECRGYVDMATATGKTVLGLAAIAHHFGALHPRDRELSENEYKRDSDRRATVLIVAHRGLILDQWKREFDIHLNIPQQRSTQSGEHTVEFEWGDVHFWTPNRLQEDGVPDTDLVILDETHHYLGSSGFGGILDDIDGHLLALSGSVDDANARTLERRDIPKLYEFTLRDGQRAGVIPQCDWDVVFTPYANQTQLADVTTRCGAGIERYKNQSQAPAEADVDRTELGFETLSEARSLAQSTAGRELKEHDEKFREFASAIMARQMTQYNLSPALSTVVNLTLDTIDDHKCVVLLESKDEIEEVAEQLRGHLGEAYDSLVTVFDDDTTISAIERFDQEQENGALVGIAKTLGEGIDIETADVCINRGRGRLSRSLVQRMGRILRNPTGDKHARFFHVSGLPTRDDSRLVDEDGAALLETASQLLSWGEKFHAQPVFDVDTGTRMTERELIELEQAGADAIMTWAPDHYEWPSDEAVRDKLQNLCSRIQESEGSALLSIERTTQDMPERTSETPDETYTDPAAEQSIEFVSASETDIKLAGWLSELAKTAAESDELESFVEESVRSYVKEAVHFPDITIPQDPAEVKEVEINPALDALIVAYSDGGAREAVVHTAIAARLLDQSDSIFDKVESGHSRKKLEAQLMELTRKIESEL